jgi:hypothetical protein
LYLWSRILYTSVDSRSTFHKGYPQTTYRGVLVGVNILNTPIGHLLLSSYLAFFTW